ncbi:MAG: hypothetical protein GY811_11570 [Myxococcales bacterium]|nr:hypothetical protein [Myxococcales bacterium]
MSKHDERKNLLQETAGGLKGYVKRLFMARTVNEFFEGVPYRAEQELGWNRATLKKGLHELRAPRENLWVKPTCNVLVERATLLDRSSGSVIT